MNQWVRNIASVVGRTPLGNPLRWLYEVVAHRDRLSWMNRRHDRDTIRIMKAVLRPDSNCIDVGAYRGTMLEPMLRRAPRGTHHAFEPIPELAEQLRTKFPSVRIHNLALSDREGQTTFRHVLNRPAYSGLRERSYPQSDISIQVIPVQTQRLDDVVSPEFRVDFIKIDVEGGELQVLRGAERILRRCRPYLVFEHYRGAAEHYGTRPEMVYDLLVATCGLRISLLRAWLKHQRPLSGEEFVREFVGSMNFVFLAHPE